MFKSPIEGVHKSMESWFAFSSYWVVLQLYGRQHVQ